MENKITLLIEINVSIRRSEAGYNLFRVLLSKRLEDGPSRVTN